MAAKTGFLRRATHYPSGIAAGGGETGFDIYPQQTLLAKRASSADQDVILPKGSIISEILVFPDPDHPAVAGTVDVDSWNIVTNASIASLVAAAPATAYLKTVLDPVTPLAADTRFRINPTGIGAKTYVVVAFKVILPPTLK